VDNTNNCASVIVRTSVNGKGGGHGEISAVWEGTTVLKADTRQGDDRLTGRQKEAFMPKASLVDLGSERNQSLRGKKATGFLAEREESEVKKKLEISTKNGDRGDVPNLGTGPRRVC